MRQLNNKHKLNLIASAFELMNLNLLAECARELGTEHISELSKIAKYHAENKRDFSIAKRMGDFI